MTRPTPADVPSRRLQPEQHSLRIRIASGFTYLTPEESPEACTRRRSALLQSIAKLGPVAFVDVPLIDGRSVQIRTGSVDAVEYGDLPRAVRRALIREGVLDPVDGRPTGHLSTERVLSARGRGIVDVAAVAPSAAGHPDLADDEAASA